VSSSLRPVLRRTALVHDRFGGYFGSEQVVDVLRGGLFDRDNPPDIFTFYAAHDRLPPELAARIRQVSRLTKLPGMRQRGVAPGAWRYLLPFMPGYFRRLKLDGYELVLTSSHTFAMQTRAPEGVLHVVYCHTPVRYAWLPREAGDRRRGLAGLALRAARGRLQRRDREAARGPDSIVANSTAVQERIRRFYGRDAVVIHPPVNLDDLAPTPPADGTFLWVHRLVPHKRPEVVAEAFAGLPYRLVMVGSGMLERSLRGSLPPNVELHPWLPRSELARLYAEAAGFLHIGEEDFGMSMVEALGGGTPVIALNLGGARDIVRPGVDGLLLDTADVASVRAAVLECASRTWDPEALSRRAHEFSTQRFLQRFRDHLTELGVE
jgi:glycosyltransferase involved in cell wall biosynthesis